MTQLDLTISLLTFFGFEFLFYFRTLGKNMIVKKFRLNSFDSFFHFNELLDFSDELFSISGSDAGISNMNHLIINEEIDLELELVHIERF